MIDKYIRRKGYDPQNVLKSTYLNRAIKDLNVNSLDELYTQISYGGAFQSKVVNQLLKYHYDKRKQEKAKLENTIENLHIDEKRKIAAQKQRDRLGITVDGMDGLMIRVSKCCNPVPGDDIIGFITKGRGISVHRVDCSNIKALPESEKVRCIKVEWDQRKMDKTYNADITVIAEDHKGLFSNISKACEDYGARISGVNAKSSKDETLHILLTLSISNTSQMQKILTKLKSVNGIIEVYRAETL